MVNDTIDNDAIIFEIIIWLVIAPAPAPAAAAAAAAATAAASPALIDDRHWHRIVAFFSIRETILQAIFPSFCSLLLCLSVCLPLNYEKSIRSSNVVTANG